MEVKNFIKIEEHLLKNHLASLYFENSPLKTDIALRYYYYPHDAKEATNDTIEASLKQAGYQKLYIPLRDMMKTANITPPPEHEMDSENNWVFCFINLKVSPPIKESFKKYFNEEKITFICVPFINNQNQRDFSLLISSPSTGRLFLEMKSCRLLKNGDETDKKYFEIFNEAVNFICEELEIR